MPLKLYNTLTRKKEAFRPLDPANVRMYVCGPTVYDYAHIGNARPVIVFDVLFRLLRHLYGPDHVTYARNITDVDDKINVRAAEEYPNLPLNEAIRKVTQRTEKQFYKDVQALRCLRPTVEPRATEHIAEMRAMIERLIERGCAYVAEDHVLFHVAAMPDYGQLSCRSVDEMIAGARVEVAPFKRDPMDFVLWKPSKSGEPAWPSPAGIEMPGRPGWHIECSAMADKWLWEEAKSRLSPSGLSNPHMFDIHGGGIDLCFPHHENEIAQSRCANSTPIMAQVWMHNGFLEVEGKKMAKSLGNFVTIHELLRTSKFGDRSWSGDSLRVAMLQTHYRQPIDWTVRMLEQAESRLNNWRRCAAERTGRKSNEALRSEFIEALKDDLNTPAAFSVLDRVCADDQSDERDRHTVFRLLGFLGIRTTKTKVARAAESLALAARKVSRIPENRWAQIFEDVTKPTTEQPQAADFVASVQALAQLETLLKKRVSRDAFEKSMEAFDRVEWKRPTHAGGQRLFLSYARDTSPHESRYASTQSLLKSLQSTFRNISDLSLHDWRSLAENVRRRPTFLSGELKPEAMLFIYLVTFEHIGQRLAARMGDDVRTRVRERLREYMRLITPQEQQRERYIDQLVAARNAARNARNFEEADRIRDRLAEMGVQLKDAKDPETGELVTTWEVAR